MEQESRQRRMPRGYYDADDNRVLWQEAEGQSSLPSVIWHITDRCPLSCPFCFATKTRDEVDSGRIRQVVAALTMLGTAKVDIAGGEPLVCRFLPEVIDALERRGIAMTITTSASGSPRLRSWLLERAPAFARVIVSVDGPAALHDGLRGRAGAAGSAWRFARALVARGVRVRINTVLTRALHDDPGLLAELAEQVVEAGVREWMLIQPHPANAKDSFGGHEIGGAEFVDALATATRTVDDLADHSGRPDVLSRDRARYSSYHLIYPDGVLRRHTAGPADVAGVEVAPENVAAIEQFVRTAPSCPAATPSTPRSDHGHTLEPGG